MVLSRRRLLLTLSTVLLGGRAGLRAGQTGLDRFATAGPPCDIDPRATPLLEADGTFREGAPARMTLGTGGSPLDLRGTVAGLSCGRVAGARVDLWQADAAGVVDPAGFRFRGYQRTGADGGFRFQTVVPGAARGRAPHLSIRVRVDGTADAQTELFLPGDPRNATDPRFRPELLLRVVEEGGRRSASFDILLDI